VLHRLSRLVIRIENVHAVGDEAANAVARGLVRDVRHGHLLLETRRDREQVVLDDEDDRQLVDRREVDRLMKVTWARRCVAAERRRRCSPLSGLRIASARPTAWGNSVPTHTERVTMRSFGLEN
jgi:hypothetical protein